MNPYQTLFQAIGPKWLLSPSGLMTRTHKLAGNGVSNYIKDDSERPNYPNPTLSALINQVGTNHSASYFLSLAYASSINVVIYYYY